MPSRLPLLVLFALPLLSTAAFAQKAGDAVWNAPANAAPPAQTMQTMQPTQPMAQATSTSPDGRIRLFLASQPPTPNGAPPPEATDARAVEIQADIARNCNHNVVVTSDASRADYMLVVQRRDAPKGMGGTGLVGLEGLAGAKVEGASLFERSGDMIYATKQRNTEKAIRDICGHIH